MSSNDVVRWVAAGALVLGACSAHAAVDLAAVVVAPQRGQSSEQLRRDRYECHNWAVDQTGVVPLAAPAQADRAERTKRARRAERIDRALNGAAIGGSIGGLIRAAADRNPANGVLAGAAVGAAVGAATAGGDARASDGPTDGEAEYLRALSACLEGRGYSVALPEPPGAEGEIVAAR